jgi:hypothetical protein
MCKNDNRRAVCDMEFNIAAYIAIVNSYYSAGSANNVYK